MIILFYDRPAVRLSPHFEQPSSWEKKKKEIPKRKTRQIKNIFVGKETSRKKYCNIC